MNCLQFALGFWDRNRDYDIFYNSDHVINLRDVNEFFGYMPLYHYGYEHICESFEGLLTAHDKVILKRYFDLKNGYKACHRGKRKAKSDKACRT